LLEALVMSLVQDALAFVSILAFSVMLHGWGTALIG
jgi:hypothetical protein